MRIFRVTGFFRVFRIIRIIRFFCRFLLQCGYGIFQQFYLLINLFLCGILIRVYALGCNYGILQISITFICKITLFDSLCLNDLGIQLLSVNFRRLFLICEFRQSRCKLCCQAVDLLSRQFRILQGIAECFALQRDLLKTFL